MEANSAIHHGLSRYRLPESDLSSALKGSTQFYGYYSKCFSTSAFQRRAEYEESMSLIAAYQYYRPQQLPMNALLLNQNPKQELPSTLLGWFS